MKKLLTIIMVVVLTFVLSGCSEELTNDEQLKRGRMCHLTEHGTFSDTYVCDNYYTSDQVDILIKEAINDFEDELEDDFEYIQDNYPTNDDIRHQVDSNFAEFYLELLQEFVTDDEYEDLLILIDIVLETEYNTVEDQCLTDDVYVCYNNNFIYRIINNDTIHFSLGVQGEFKVDFRLVRQDDADFYYTFIGYMTQSSLIRYDEYYEVYETTHFSGSAVSLIANFIADAEWDVVNEDNFWEKVKSDFGVTDE